MKCKQTNTKCNIGEMEEELQNDGNVSHLLYIFRVVLVHLIILIAFSMLLAMRSIIYKSIFWKIFILSLLSYLEY